MNFLLFLGWHTYWKPERPFPLDMAGFAISLQLLLSKVNAKFALRVRRGYQESVLLQQLVTQTELEPRAENCSKVNVVLKHTKITLHLLRYPTNKYINKNRKKSRESLVKTFLVFICKWFQIFKMSFRLMQTLIITAVTFLF